MLVSSTSRVPASTLQDTLTMATSMASADVPLMMPATNSSGRGMDILVCMGEGTPSGQRLTDGGTKAGTTHNQRSYSRGIVRAYGPGHTTDRLRVGSHPVGPRCVTQQTNGHAGGLAAEHRVRHGTATTPRRHACGGSGQHTVALKGAGTAVCRPQRRRDGLCAWCRPLRQKGTKRSGSGTAGHWGMPSPPSRTPPGRPPYKRITIVLPHFARTKHADATRAGGGNRKQQCRLRRSVRQRGHQQTAGVDAREYLLTPETYESSESHPRKICRFG